MHTIQEQIAAVELANNTGNYTEAETICRQLLAQDLPPEEKAKALLQLSQSLLQRGKSQEALPFVADALSIAEQLQHKELQGKALGNIGTVYFYISDYPKALEYYRQALGLAEELGNRNGMAINLGNIGMVYRNISDYPKALEYYRQALGLAEELGNRNGVATNLGNIGLVYFSIADYPKALEYYQQTITIYQELHNRSGEARHLGNIGLVYDALGSYSLALDYYHQALAVDKELDNKIGISRHLSNIGIVYRKLLDYSRALDYYQQALVIDRELGNKSGISLNLGNLGTLYLNLLDYSRALDYYQQALVINEDLGRKSSIAINLSNLGTVYAQEGFSEYNPRLAEQYLLQAIAIEEKLGRKLQLCEAYKSLADLYKQEDRWKEHSEYIIKYYETEKDVQTEEAKKKADQMDYERKEAEREKQRAIRLAQAETMEKLLYKTFPSPIVPQLQNGEELLVERFPAITALFADLAGFTKLSTQISPHTLIAMLNIIFTKFDAIIKEAGGHRLRTIGDGYFAICGAPDLVENHQYKLAKAALAMQQDIVLPTYIKQELPEGTVLDIRIGLHCGEAVCGMVGGLEKWQYDAYGDTINTASRMESHGEAGKIHISEDFKNSLMDYDEFTFLPREPMFIKGKGLMNTYFLQ